MNMAPRAGFDTEKIHDKARKDLLHLLEGVSRPPTHHLRRPPILCCAASIAPPRQSSARRERHRESD
jgi:hypothetical protein